MPSPTGAWPFFTGTFADYYYIRPGTPVFKVPGALSDDVLAPVNCAMGTVIQGLISAGATQGQSIVIQGAGGLGLTGAAMAKDMGADQVIVFDRLENRLALAREFGADHTVNVDDYATVDERVAVVRELTDGRGADIVLELVGIPDLLPEGVAMLRTGGTFVEIGLFFSSVVPFDPSTLVLTGKRIIGSIMYKPVVLARVLDFLVRTKETRPFDRLVSHRFDLADINDAFARSEWQQAEETPVTRAVIVP